MTKDDFRRWYSVHRAAFPAVDAWIRKYPAEPVQDGPLSQREILASWFSVLESEDLPDCLAATQAINRGEAEPPKMFDDHARVVRRIASERRHVKTKQMLSSYTTGHTHYEPRYRCLRCLDSGTVECWHPITMRLVRANGPDIQRGIYTTAVRCDCERGVNRQSPPCLFDEHIWLPVPIAAWPNRLREYLPELLEFVEGIRPENYQTCFDNF